MTMVKKMLSAGWVLILILSLTACGNLSDAAGEGDGKITIVYAHDKNELGVEQKIIEAFEKKHPHIDVQSKEMPSNTGISHDQYVTMFSGGSDEIDVFDMDVIWPAEFAQAGYLEPLNRYIERDGIDLDKYSSGAVQAGMYNGQQWAMPRYQDQGLLYYRKDLIDQPPETWDQMIQLAEEHQGEAGTRFGYVFQGKQYEGLVCNFIEFIGAYGGKILDDQGRVTIQSEDTVQGLKKMTQIAKSDIVPGNLASITEVETDAIFGEGQTVFDRQWPGHYAYVSNEQKSEVNDRVGVTSLPKGDEGRAAALGGWMAGISKNSNQKKAAWEFVKFLTGPEGQKISAVYGGYAPTYMPLYEDKDVKKANPLFANEDYVQSVKTAIPRPVSPEYPKISDIIQVEVSKTLTGEQTPERAVQKMDQKLKKVFE